MNLLIIKALCDKKGILLKDLAGRIGMSYQNLNRCTRENKISADDLEAIADVLEVPISIFFNEDNVDGSGKKIIQNGNNNNTMVGNGNSNDNANKELENCKKELEAIKRESALKDKIIEILEKDKQ